MSTGYLTRILNGQVELRVGVVLRVCQVIGLPAGVFFAALFPGEPGSRLGRGLAQLHPGTGQGSGGAEGLLRQIRALLVDFEAAGDA